MVTWDGGGNVPPALGIAAELKRRGHQVRFLGHPRQRLAIEAAGFTFRPFEHARPWAATDDNGAWDYFAMFTDPRPGADVHAALAGADLVVVDCMTLGALRAALASGVPVAVLAHTFHRYLTHNWARGPIGLLGRLRGLPPQRMWNRAAAVLVTSDRGLDPAVDLPANVLHVGPVQHRPDTAAVGPERTPHVLVSLSTINYPRQPEALQHIVDALAHVGMPATVTTGDTVDPETIRAPAGVTVRATAPHDELMPQATLVVGHGGHGTTMRALAHDLPLLVLPLHPMLDQPMVGKAVAAAGAGLVLPATASPDRIGRAIRTLYDDPAYRTNAARIGERIRATSGAVTAADRLEVLMSSAPGGLSQR